MTNKSAVILLSALAICSTRVDAAQVTDAEKFPVKPVRYIIPFPPGAGSDLTARTIAQKLSEIWKVQVIADNRTGASGVIGVEAASRYLMQKELLDLSLAELAEFQLAIPPYNLWNEVKLCSNAAQLKLGRDSLLQNLINVALISEEQGKAAMAQPVRCMAVKR